MGPLPTGDAATLEFRRSPILLKAKSPRYPPSPTNTCLAWILALIVPSLFYIGPCMLLLPFILYFMFSLQAALLSLIVNLILAYYPHKPCPRFRRIFQLWFSIFDFHHNLILNEKDGSTITPQEASCLSICAMHPHGVIPIQAFLWMAYCDLFLRDSYGFGAAASVVMHVPLLRQVLKWGSADSADYSVLHYGLSNGNNLFILPGGVAEIFHKRSSHSVKATRRGLMRLALQTGACLVPVYVFGGNDFYHQIGLEKLSRKSKAAFALFWGQYGTPLPYPTRCSMVLGDPIVPCGRMGQESIVKNSCDGSPTPATVRTAEKVPNPTNEQIDELMKRYMDALQRLFDQYKAQAGYPNAELEIR